MSRNRRRVLPFSFSKRQKFVLSVGVLSIMLFFLEQFFQRTPFYVSLFLALSTEAFLFWSIRNDLSGKKSLYIFILPFFYSLSFGLFYYLFPARLLTRLATTSLFAFGLYSLFLSMNIFTVASIRTIALLNGARIVTFVITLLTFFFLSNVTLSLKLGILPTSGLLFLFSFPLILQSLWTYDFEKDFKENIMWTFLLTLCLFEISLVLWFWPSSPTIVALFLAGFFYTIVGLSHVWYDRKLFRGVIWEYLWVAVVVFFVLVFSTSWLG